MKMRLTIKKRNGLYEGYLKLSNLLPTKMRRRNGSTLYKSVGNLKTAAKRVARKYNAELEV